MPILNLLRELRSSSPVAYQKYINNRAKDKTALHLFFEGSSDPHFYYHLVIQLKSINPSKIFYYDCGNKDGVLITRGKVRNRTKFVGEIRLFFVDRDFSTILGERNPATADTFVTRWYSIENYLVSKESAISTINLVLRFTKDSVDFSELIDKYDSNILEYYSFMSLVSALIIWARQNGQKCDLRDIKIHQMFSFAEDLSICISINALEKFSEKAGIKFDKHANLNQIEEIAKNLRNNHPKNFTRGKFEIAYLVAFCKKVIGVVKEFAENQGSETKIMHNLSEKWFLEYMSPRIPVASDLSKFIDDNLT